MNDVAGQRLAQLVDVHVVTRPFHVIGDIVRRRITTQFIRADILNHFSHDSEPSRSRQARIVTVASVCSASARVAVTSGIVLLAWLWDRHPRVARLLLSAGASSGNILAACRQSRSWRRWPRRTLGDTP